MQKEKKGNTVLKGCCFIVLIIIVAVIGGCFYAKSWYEGAIFNPNSDSKDEISIDVLEGDNINTISKTLETQGLIKSETALKVYLRLNNLTPNIKVGTYSIPKNLTVPQLLNLLEKGVLKESTWVTLREGLRNEEVADTLDKKFNEFGDAKKFDKNEFLNIASNPGSYKFSTDTQAFLDKYKPVDKDLTGFLFPDTYNFDYDSTAQTVIDKMIQNLSARIKEKNIDIDNFKKGDYFQTFYDGLTLASVVEKEAAGDGSDKQNISSVFHNRLDSGMYLQSDAILAFYTKSTNPSATFDELKIDTPYNTYLYPGLPPTPICNPGIDAIFASFNPSNTNYYFFRYDEKGVPYFSETYDQHQQSVYDHP